MRAPLGVLVTTYAPGQLRVDAAKRSIESWKEHLIVDSDREILLHIADDGSAPSLNYGEDWWRKQAQGWAHLTYSRQEQGGIGMSLNKGIAALDTPIILYPMDDWSLLYPMQIEPWITLLVENDDTGCIRMGQPSGSVRGGRGKRFGLLVGVDFERYAFYWSLTPALYHRRFFDAYGAFKEEVSPAACEDDYNRRIISTPGPAVLVAMLNPWQHLWSIKTGDLKPNAKVDPARLRGTITTTGYDSV